jgi:hypothetical protein
MTAPSEETRAQPVEVTCPGCFHPREWDAASVCGDDRGNSPASSSIQTNK